MVLSQKRVDCPLWVRGGLLPQVEEFNYLAVFFTSKGKIEHEHETDRRIGAALAVMRTLNQSVAVKRELCRKVNPLIYWSIYVPTLIYGHELWVVTERMRPLMRKRE